MIPVSIVTGFLGSGKTTLIGRILRDPAFARTAVIVNEFGEIGLDHELIASSDETLMALTTGCVCCAVRSDLVATMMDLHARRSAGEIAYERVLIETSGLADPAPILQALMVDPDVSRHYALDTVLTVADAMFGKATLDAHPEARRQVLLADLLAISKTDIAGNVEPLRARLAAMNPGAEQLPTRELDPVRLFSGADPLARAERLLSAGGTGRWRAATGYGSYGAVQHTDAMPSSGSIIPPIFRALHTDGVESFVLKRGHPVPAIALTLLLQALTEHCGARLLRVKGLVEVEEMPGRPALIYGVQHVFSAPEFLPGWPSDNRSTRLVFIARGVPRHFPARLLDAIEEEVRDEIARAKT